MDSLYVAVSEPTHVSEARRAVLRLAPRLGLNEVESGNAAIVVSEAASNIIKHAGAGDVVIRPLSLAGHSGIEVLALDKGPGIPNITLCLGDGFSSKGTAGTGLGAMKRLSSTFHIYSRTEHGTALVARLWSSGASEKTSHGLFSVGGVCIPHPDEDTPGDSWSAASDLSQCAVMVADGLGHGFQAAESARAAASLFERKPFLSPKDLLGMAHEALRSTRGAAAAVARVDGEKGCVDYAGIGNIEGVLVDPGQPPRHMISHNGTLGHTVRRIAGFQYAWPADGLLLMYSDGLSTHWSLDPYPGLIRCDPALIAGVLCRDFRRPNDDVTVVVVKRRPGLPAREAC